MILLAMAATAFSTLRGAEISEWVNLAIADAQVTRRAEELSTFDLAHPLAKALRVIHVSRVSNIQVFPSLPVADLEEVRATRLEARELASNSGYSAAATLINISIRKHPLWDRSLATDLWRYQLLDKKAKLVSDEILAWAAAGRQLGAESMMLLSTALVTQGKEYRGQRDYCLASMHDMSGGFGIDRNRIKTVAPSLSMSQLSLVALGSEFGDEDLVFLRKAVECDPFDGNVARWAVAVFKESSTPEVAKSLARRAATTVTDKVIREEMLKMFPLTQRNSIVWDVQR